MNNFDNWKTGLTVESFYAGKTCQILCSVCPVDDDCNHLNCSDKFRDWAESEYMPPNTQKTKVEQLADLLGVEVGEDFNVKYAETGVPLQGNPHVLKDDGQLVDCNGNKWIYLLSTILTGETVIEKIPQQPEEWKPKTHGHYFRVSSIGEIEHCIYKIEHCIWTGVCSNMADYAMGNCFPTEEAAEVGKADVLAKYEAIRRELE